MTANLTCANCGQADTLNLHYEKARVYMCSEDSSLTDSDGKSVAEDDPRLRR